MTCPKCGSGVADGAPQCGICFFNLEEGADQSAGASAPLAFRMPVAPTIVDQDEPVAGIPGIDNMPSAAPLGGAPAPLPGVGSAPLPGAGSGQFRVSLTGEMIEVPGAMPTMSTRSMDGRQPGAASLAGNGAAALPPPVGIRPQVGAPAPPRAGSSMPGRSGASSRRISPRPAADEYARPKSKAGPIVATILVLLLAGGGAFGWFYWQKTHGPAGAVEKALKAFQSKDWKTFYAAIEWPAEVKSLLTESNFNKAMDFSAPYVKLTDYKIGDASVTGDTATVSVTQTVEVSAELAKLAPAAPTGKQTKTATVNMKKVGGEWKIDGSQLPSMGPLGGGSLGGGMGGTMGR